MSTPIITVAVQVEVTGWTSPANGSGPYTAVATLVAADNSTNVTVSNNVIKISAPNGSPVQINLNPWTNIAGLTFTLGAPYKEVVPTGDSAAEYSIVLLDRYGKLTANSATTWSYNGITYTISAIPTNGVAVIDLNNGGGEYSYNLTLLDSKGHWGILDPDVENDPTET
ncbi:MAG: hypothetical protein RLZZ15_2868 [Verrucomicrobiota bacterium]|jgi:hypothetical protein